VAVSLHLAGDLVMEPQGPRIPCYLGDLCVGRTTAVIIRLGRQARNGRIANF
jgi:hypothetical protein